MKKIFFILLILSFVKAQTQEQKKDTLFIKYDEKILKKWKHPTTKKYFYSFKHLKENVEYICFEQKKVCKKTTTSSSIKNFKEIFKESKTYNIYNRFRASNLFDFLLNYKTIFFS